MADAPVPLVKANTGGLRTGQYHTGPCEDNYKFGRTLGKGSFATVKLATCKEDGSKWAIKVIDKRALNQEDKEALQVECDTMMQVNHDNIVRLKEVYDNNNNFYMVLEICSGGELFDRIVEMEKYSEADARFAFAQMTEAVGHCHKLNIVHRDLKPENLLYAGALPNMTLKLADFGLAQIVTAHKHLHTACGTPGYVAPEILMGEEYDKEVDMWSLGVILYILLCGFPPFYEEHTPELFKIIKKGEYDFPSPYWDDISDGAKDLVKKLLVVDPKKRFTAADVFTHAWMEDKSDSSGKTLVHFQGNLRKYNAKRKFKGAIEGVMMANMLQRVLKAGARAAAEKIQEKQSPKNSASPKKVEAEGAAAEAGGAPAAEAPAAPAPAETAEKPAAAAAEDVPPTPVPADATIAA
ncbi:hypothetical protein TeGR_g18 [Tetraparma gracilis]|uniref:Protein kinase domain-containing protein n=1 Tax=Tetraparma gracilis TaxID=2962635 RepID=A0ABQ6N0M4_9STRA|nr:hypothetical protein TeGR_g18 [Tetraparma gracilis]